MRKRELHGKTCAFFGAFTYWPAYHEGTPSEVARRLGAQVRETVDEGGGYVVVGDGRGAGRAEAKRKAERLAARAEKSKQARVVRVVDEAAFRAMVRVDVTDKTFFFAGTFACAPDGLPARMAQAVG